MTAVPHGEIHHHFYKSAIVGDNRDYYVYTPPGYDSKAARCIRCFTCCMATATMPVAGQR